jgi:hypothetical protein
MVTRGGESRHSFRRRVPENAVDTIRPWRGRLLARVTFVASCARDAATKFTQIHHEQLWARGDGETVDNLRILCASHNRLLAEREFGRELVAERIAKPVRVVQRGT